MARHYTAIPYVYLEECEMLSDAEFGALIRGLLRYSLTGEPIEAEGNARFFAKRMMLQEDLNRKRYTDVCHGRKRAGAREEPCKEDQNSPEENREA